MNSILIREYYVEDEVVVYTGRDTVCPGGNIDYLRRWANEHIQNWQNIELFRLEQLPVFFGKE
jgi:hypothetical protein